MEHLNIIWVVNLIPLSFTFSQKKIKLSTAENLSVIPQVHEEENGSAEGHIHHQLSVVKKDKKKHSNLSSQSNKSSNLNKQKNDKSDPTSDETRCNLFTFVIYIICQMMYFPYLIVHCSVYFVLFGQGNKLIKFYGQFCVHVWCFFILVILYLFVCVCKLRVVL